ncbi:hypothetical protein MASR2M70_20300 [Bacillota bacterium]
MVFSIATEFIENENENVSKQDCEINAFKRLAPKLKHKYPRLPICLLADSLYVPVNRYSKYAGTINGGSIPIQGRQYKEYRKEFRIVTALQGREGANCTWVNDMDYNQKLVNLIEAEAETGDKGKEAFCFHHRYTNYKEQRS